MKKRRKWGPKFSVQFVAKLLKSYPENCWKCQQKCYDLIKIDATERNQHLSTYTKVSYCDEAQNFTFTQWTTRGLKSVVFHIENIGQKIIFKTGVDWAGYVKFKYEISGKNIYEDSTKYFIGSGSKNSVKTEETKIEISTINSEYIEIFDLVITEDEQKEPDDYIKAHELGPEW